MRGLTPTQKLFYAIFYEYAEATNPPDVSTEQVEEIISSLTPREQEVIRLRFGFKGNPLTLEQIGITLLRADNGGGVGVSRERVRQIETKALDKLRHSKHVKTLGLV